MSRLTYDTTLDWLVGHIGRYVSVGWLMENESFVVLRGQLTKGVDPSQPDEKGLPDWKGGEERLALHLYQAEGEAIGFGFPRSLFVSADLSDDDRLLVQLKGSQLMISSL